MQAEASPKAVTASLVGTGGTPPASPGKACRSVGGSLPPPPPGSDLPAQEETSHTAVPCAPAPAPQIPAKQAVASPPQTPAVASPPQTPAKQPADASKMAAENALRAAIRARINRAKQEEAAALAATRVVRFLARL